MIRLPLVVANKLGLHARAAAKLVRLVCGFSSEVHLSRENQNQYIDARSILGVLMMAASQGTGLIASIEGADETAAGEAIRELFENRFGEEN
jgi:phosphocarrier protein